MAIFSNQATLTYNGSPTSSNIAYGEILDVLTASKTSIEKSYAPGDLLTYSVALKNTGSAALTALTVSDDLGGYVFNGDTVYPLTYVDGTATLFIGGVLQAAPTISSAPPLSISGINIPGGYDAVLIYKARVSTYASPAEDGSVVNTVTVTGVGLSSPVTATETVTAASSPILAISKSLAPSQIVDNDRITYTFVIQNSGSTAVTADGNATVSDTFDPRLSALTVTFNGVTLTEGAQYSYDETTGVFVTGDGIITVPAATFSQDAVTGEYSVLPGISTLTVSGTV